MIIMFAEALPYGVDPLACLGQFNFLRTEWCSRYYYHFEKWELHLAGSESDRDCGNPLIDVIEEFDSFTRARKLPFQWSKCDSLRTHNHQRSPKNCAFASTERWMRFH
jgi:hypothetical protein